MPAHFTLPPEEGITPEPGLYDFGLDETSRYALNRAPGLMSYTRLNRHDDPARKVGTYVAGIGNLVSDTLLFGREAIMGRYEFHGKQIPYNTKEGKAFKKAWTEANPGVTLIRPKERAEAEHLIQCALANPEIKDILNAPGFCEAGVVADLQGVRFRSWLDKLTKGAVFDIKTSREATEAGFMSKMFDYKYDVQATLYLDQCEAIGLGQLRYFWIVISKTGHRAWVTELPNWAYHSGRRWRDSAIRSYKRETALKARLTAAQETTDGP